MQPWAICVKGDAYIRLFWPKTIAELMKKKKHNMYQLFTMKFPFCLFFGFFLLFIRFENLSEYSFHVICSFGSRLSSAEREIKTFFQIIIQNDHSHCLWPRPFQRTNRNISLFNKNEKKLFSFEEQFLLVSACVSMFIFFFIFSFILPLLTNFYRLGGIDRVVFEKNQRRKKMKKWNERKKANKMKSNLPMMPQFNDIDEDIMIVFDV